MGKTTLLMIIFGLILAFQSQTILAQTTLFTYQGSLKVGGIPANGLYDFQFSMFDASVGGTQIGTSIGYSAREVIDGVFSVELSFGNIYEGPTRFLEIKVRQEGGAAYTTLTPRQPVRSVPASIQSLNATNAANATNAVNATNAAQLGGIAPSGFIQNTTVQQPSTNFNISGTGTAGGTLSGNIVNSNTYFSLQGVRVFTANSTLFNTFVGQDSGTNITTGQRNSFFGFGSGSLTAFGTRNSFFGYNSGGLNTNSQNSFFGYNSGGLNTTGGTNSFFGDSSGAANTTGGANSFFGAFSGAFNTTGGANSFFGRDSGLFNTEGSSNSFFGTASGKQNSDGSNNSFFGNNAGLFNTTGSGNSIFGFSAGFENTTGADNAFFGVNTGRGNTFGSRNTFYGRLAGRFNTTGDDNTFVGYNSASSSVTGSSNTALGANSNVSDGLTFATAIGAGATVSSSSTVVLGRTDDIVRIPGFLRVVQLGSAGSTVLCRNGNDTLATCSSSIRYKSNINNFNSGLGLIKRLRPVSFNWIEDGMLDIGLVAEEVAEIEPLLTTTKDQGEVEGVKYDRIGVVLVNAVNEQQAQIESLHQQIDGQSETIRRQQTRLAEQDERLRKLQAEIEALKQLVCAINPEAKLCQPMEGNK